MAGEIKLGGRIFVLVNYAAITSLNEHYVMKLMRETGLDKVLPEDDGLPSYEEIEAARQLGKLGADEAADLLRQKSENDTAYFNRLQQAIVDSLRLHDLLAGYMLPLGKTEADWSLELAAETSRFLKGLQSPDDRAEIHRLGSVVVFDFFRAGVASLKTFPSSLSETAPATTKTATTNGATAAH